MAAFSKDMQNLPESVQKLVAYVVQKVAPMEIILFGSRARGDNREKSDFDLAVKGPVDAVKWTQLKVDLDEKAFSLYPVDLVLYADLGEDYRQNIQAEGKLIYG